MTLRLWRGWGGASGQRGPGSPSTSFHGSFLSGHTCRDPQLIQFCVLTLTGQVAECSGGGGVLVSHNARLSNPAHLSQRLVTCPGSNIDSLREALLGSLSSVRSES